MLRSEVAHFFQTQRKPFLFQSPVSKLNLDFNDRLSDEVEAAAAGAAVAAAAAAGAERACSCTRHKPEPDLSQFFLPSHSKICNAAKNCDKKANWID